MYNSYDDYGNHSHDCGIGCNYCSRYHHARMYDSLSLDEKKINRIYSAVRTCKGPTLIKLVKKGGSKLLDKLFQPFNYVSYNDQRRVYYKNILQRMVSLQRYDLVKLLPYFELLNAFPSDLSNLILRFAFGKK